MKNNSLKSQFTLTAWFVAILCGFTNFASGQYSVKNYFFQQQIGTYSEISGGTILGSITIDEEVFNASTTGATTTTAGAGFPIGFPFSFNGQVFTRFAVGTNGYVTLGNDVFSIPNSVSSAFNGTPFNLPDTAFYANMLAALHLDLQGQTGSELSFITTGTEPNRECVIQWKKFRIYLATIGDDNFNFQIRLQENGNKVVFSYGAFQKAANNRLASVGIRGNAYNVVQMRKANVLAAETWASSIKSLDRTIQTDFQPTFLPDNGLNYTFYNPAQTAHDIGLDKLSLSPSVAFGCPGTVNEPIQVRIFNYGDSTETSIPYQVQINGAAAQNGILSLNPPLAKNQSRIINLSQTVDLSTPGPVNIKVWSEIPLDTGIYAINDTSSIKTTVFASIATPSAPIRSFNEFIAKGWKSYRGRNKPVSNDGRFTAGTQFSSSTSSINVQAFSSDTISDWLVSPAFQPSANLRLKFRAAITGFDTINPITNGIDNDEIRFLISDNCGQTWNTIYSFNNNSVTGGALSNSKKGYSVQIPPVSGPFQIAVHVSNKGTAPAGTYYFHLDDLTLNQGNSFDLGARRVIVENQNNPSCSQTSFAVKAWIKNDGDSLIATSPISVSVNNGTPQIQNFNFSPALNAGDSSLITFAAVTINPNSAIKVMVRTVLPSEDGFSVANDTASYRYVYIGATTPLSIPAVINFDNLPSGVPAGWLVEQSQGSDFKVRVRGTNSTRSLSTNLYSGNRSSYAIAPATEVLPTNSQLSFDIRLKNDLAGSFGFGASDSVTASISTDCGASWIGIFKTKAGQPFGFDNFQTATADLTPYAGNAVAIKFEGWIYRTDNTGTWIDIDNIGISENTAVENLVSDFRPRFFPNPSSDAIQFSLPPGISEAFFKISALDGKEIASHKISRNSKIELNELPAGIYLTEIIFNNRIVRDKLIVK